MRLSSGRCASRLVPLLSVRRARAVHFLRWPKSRRICGMMDDMTIANAKWRGRRSRTSLEHRPEYTMQRNDQVLARSEVAVGGLPIKPCWPNWQLRGPRVRVSAEDRLVGM